MIRRVARLLAVLIALNLFSASVAFGLPEGDSKPSVAERYRAILAEYEAHGKAAAEAFRKAKTEAEKREVSANAQSRDAIFSRKMVDLAASAPKDPASRGALIWVIHKTYRSDGGDYGDEVGRAVRLLVDNFADDPEAVRIGLGFDNIFSRHRDALMEGMYANAEAHEAKGLARLALARYLQSKAVFVKSMKQQTGKVSFKIATRDGDGKRITKTAPRSNESQGYIAGIRMLDPEVLRKQADALYNEVIVEYGDLPYITRRQRELETAIFQIQPPNAPITDDTMSILRLIIEKKKTLAQVAEANLDELHNLNIGQPAPEIVGKDLNGNPMKLSDYRGKVVVLVFWGSWCSPCMAEVPSERELAEKYRGKPFAILGVNCRETIDVAKKTVEREKMTWPQWYDGEEGDGPIAEKYHVRGFPTLFVIDAKGIIRHKKLHGEELDKAVGAMMANASGS